jgi:hypothetical protein
MSGRISKNFKSYYPPLPVVSVKHNLNRKSELAAKRVKTTVEQILEISPAALVENSYPTKTALASSR